MIEATLYGLPMYRVRVPQPQAPTSAVTSTVSTPQSTSVLGLQVVTVTIQPELEPRDTANGKYYSVGGEVWGGPGRPVQPRASVSITGPQLAGGAAAQEPSTAHGALLVDGGYVDEAGFDPHITRPITDVRLPEPAFHAAGWFPAKPFSVNRFGGADRLVMVAGQYNSQGNVERLYHDTTLNVYYSHSDDFTPPAILQADSWQYDSQLYFEVHAFDRSGVHRVAVTYNDGQGYWRTVDLSSDNLGRYWNGALDAPPDRIQYFIQAVDNAGNVAMSANKGLFFEPSSEHYTTFLPLVLREHR
jgi:hypothetical protein